MSKKFGEKLSNEPEIINKFDATTDPTSTNDESSGLHIGSIWVNISTKQVFSCVNDAIGAAIWKQITDQTGSAESAGVDGGSAASVYQSEQVIDGGGANA
jgi:hypothetical protein